MAVGGFEDGGQPYSSCMPVCGERLGGVVSGWRRVGALVDSEGPWELLSESQRRAQEGHNNAAQASSQRLS
jgi:hypothetical protein